MRHASHDGERNAGARLRPPNLRTTLATLAGACALLATAAPAFAGGKAEAEDSKLSTRRHRWWMDGWAHSMQEQCFIDWMDGLFGTTTWRHSMQEQDVEWVYDWWTLALWDPAGELAAE